jgi:hypothetical protein
MYGIRGKCVGARDVNPFTESVEGAAHAQGQGGVNGLKLAVSIRRIYTHPPGYA